MAKHVAVLMGGWSAEREVSLVTGAAVVEACRRLGYRTSAVDVGRQVADVLHKLRVDVAFNALHGRFGEDGTIQGLLEIMGLPYTHSGVRASANAMDKPTAKYIFAAHGLPMSEHLIRTREEMREDPGLPAPYVIKPLNEGSSVGVRIVMPEDNFRPGDDLQWVYGDTVMIERFVPGREIQVAVMGDEALGAIEIRPKGRFYDYKAKYTDGEAVHLMPAPMPEEDYAQACEIALTAHRALGCRGVSRSDLRYDESRPAGQRLVILEINTQPGMTPLSLVPEIAAHRGYDFDALVRWMIEDAGVDR
ncbi:D-alanine--D-alanine ligase [Marinibaculum pumilum]|uniref:D-alanine--D-alanine ligase n=1 Tax=Marinibaculum pumilum TaxID=1766165 RepID=A0ABV7L0V4_9PROT